MNRHLAPFIVASAVLMSTSCASHYTLTSVDRTRILIDSRYDAHPDAQATAFIAPYKHVVDSTYGTVIGTVAKDLTVKRPEGTLSNLLADILVWEGKHFNETPDFGVYNMGGVRSSLPAGQITYGDIVDVAPFENKICFLTLTGSDVLELFKQIAKVHGEGISRSVRLIITKDGRLVSANINGKPIDPTAQYRIATIDYLAQGNDHMDVFKRSTNLVSPQSQENDTRYIITSYVKEQTSKGITIDSNIEGRIKFE